MGNSLRIRRTGNIGGSVKRHPSHRYMGKQKVRMMAKLDESKVRYILRQRRRGVPAKKIADEMNVGTRWIRRLRQIQKRGLEGYCVPNTHGQTKE